MIPDNKIIAKANIIPLNHIFFQLLKAFLAYKSPEDFEKLYYVT